MAEAPLRPKIWPSDARWAPYAVKAGLSRGRAHDEAESRHRTPFQRDRDRILHSAAFRRLKHKTQVFVEHEGDYYRTRLTHSLEVAQIARTLSKALGLDEELAETVSLAHDLGHTAFGHAGETALDEAMAPYGGFDHNAQALRVVTRLETRYASFDGLNLTWETLEGLVKHNGPLVGRHSTGAKVSEDVAALNAAFPLELDTLASAEAQAAAIADDVAYNNHDLDDGLRARLFTIEEAAELPIVGEALQEAREAYPEADARRLRYEALRRVFGAMVEDVLAESVRRLDTMRPESAAAVRAAERPVIAFSAEMEARLAPLKTFLFERMYRHHRVNRMMSKAKRVIRELFERFMAEPNLLSGYWRTEIEALEGRARARRVADYVAGMTDRYAIEEHRQLFDPLAGV
ncbi:MAG: deoxyguanosinetriphosphate triphosphohydrolase [Pseudomonadota bacterium]